jgi:hypothetical protein
MSKVAEPPADSARDALLRCGDPCLQAHRIGTGRGELRWIRLLRHACLTGRVQCLQRSGTARLIRRYARRPVVDRHLSSSTVVRFEVPQDIVTPGPTIKKGRNVNWPA